MFGLVPWKKRSGDEVSVLRDPEDFPLARFREEFDAMWDRFWREWNEGTSLMGDGSRFGWDLDLEDKEDEYALHAELPGFEPEEIDVKLSGNVLTVKAEHKEEKQGDGGSSYRYGSFQRMFTLPQGVESDKIDANYHNGVLDIRLPKSEECKAKRIPVTAA